MCGAMNSYPRMKSVPIPRRKDCSCALPCSGLARKTIVILAVMGSTNGSLKSPSMGWECGSRAKQAHHKSL
jgi:hypothetical protein